MTVEKPTFTMMAALLLSLVAASAQAFPPCPIGATCTVLGPFPLFPPTSKDTFTFNLSSTSDVSFIGYTSSGSASADLLFQAGNQIGSPTLFTHMLTTQTFNDLLGGHYKYVIDGVSSANGAVLHLEEVVTAIPEPGALALLIVGLIAGGLAFGRRRRPNGIVAAS